MGRATGMAKEGQPTMCDWCGDAPGGFCYLKPDERLCVKCETELHQRLGLPEPFEPEVVNG